MVRDVEAGRRQIGALGHGVQPRARAERVDHAGQRVLALVAQHRQHRLGHRHPHRLGVEHQPEVLVQRLLVGEAPDFGLFAVEPEYLWETTDALDGQIPQPRGPVLANPR